MSVQNEPPEQLQGSLAWIQQACRSLINFRLFPFIKVCLQGNHLSVPAMQQQTSCCWWTAPGASDAPISDGSEISWRAWWHPSTSDRTTFRSVRVVKTSLFPPVGCIQGDTAPQSGRPVSSVSIHVVIHTAYYRYTDCLKGITLCMMCPFFVFIFPTICLVTHAHTHIYQS